MDPAFLDMMGATVTRKTLSSRDGYGEITYTTDSTYRARVSYSTSLVRDSNGEEKQSSAQIWLYGITSVNLSDIFVLPDGSQRLTLRVEAPMDENGVVHHVKVYVQ